MNNTCKQCDSPRCVNESGKLLKLCAKHRKYKNDWDTKHRVKKSKNLTPVDKFVGLDCVDLSYAAALIDGEGCIHFRRHIKGKRLLTFTVTIQMTDPEPLDFMHKLFGGCFRSYKSTNEKWSDVYFWGVSGKGAGALLKAIVPFMKISRKIKLAYYGIELSAFQGYNRWDMRSDPSILENRNALEKTIELGVIQ